jgi:hypothetical protein
VGAMTLSITTLSTMILKGNSQHNDEKRNTQHNDTQHDNEKHNTQYNDTQHNNLKANSQHKSTQHNNKNTTLSITISSITIKTQHSV